MVHVGFTGTRRGMTLEQRIAVQQAMFNLGMTHFHHGDCVGADAQAHLMAMAAGAVLHIYPPENPARRAFCRAHWEAFPPKPYLDRNKDIVNASVFLIAAPGEMDEQTRSGTWSTVRFARTTRKPIGIIFPDGGMRGEG
jgi:hypothetical protein